MEARLEGKLQRSHRAVEQSWAKFDAELAGN